MRLFSRSLCLLTLLSSLAYAADDVLIADFEGDDYGKWTHTGDAFGQGPARGALRGQMPVDGFKGRGLVNSFYHGDATIGTLTSPPFRIERAFISFLIGGGHDTNALALNLLVDGKIVRNATGPNDRPGGTETLVPGFWKTDDLIGKSAVIEIVDRATGGWGHINVDQIVQTDRKPPGMAMHAQREFAIEKRYLNLPIKAGPIRKVTLLVNGEKQVQNDIALADHDPEFFAPIDVSAWKGQKIVLDVDTIAEDSNALASIEQSNELKGSENLYQETLRGQFHFSARRGWNNDPNGLVYYNGEYHLFFQHNPYGWAWGNMHWGHAVSRDLVHWQELGDVMAPDRFGPMFSGSAVVDWKNSSGLGEAGKPPMVLFYTAAGDPTVQCIASSVDGRHFSKFAGNPVVPQFTGGNRDPKVIWHEPSQKWVMTLYVETNKVHTIHFLGSTNLKNWNYLSRVDGFFECPDFFELPVDGNASNRKWVLTAASSEYMVGSFDGTKFTPETPKLQGHRGRGFYAAQTFSDIPPADGRRIQIGWFQTETKGMPFNQSMTIPLELKLTQTSDGPRLTWTPVKEMETLRTSVEKFEDVTLGSGPGNPLADVKGELLEVHATITPMDAEEVTLRIRGGAIRYNMQKQELIVNGHRAPAPLRNGKQELTVFCDRTGLEVFASDGLTYVPFPFNANPDDQLVSVGITGGPSKISDLRVYQLKSAWAPQK